MDPITFQILASAVITGLVGGVISALALVPVLRAELKRLRVDVDRHEEWIHSLAGRLNAHPVLHSDRRRATS